MRRFPVFAALLLLGCGHAAQAAATVGQAAPAFTLTDTAGKKHTLADYKGKHVVLEWVNFDCPFVKKHYGSGNMQKLQKAYTGKGVVWLQVNSSAAGKEGNYAADAAAAKNRERGAGSTAYLLDADGTAGRAYGARTTPHMFLIDPAGKLLYAGGIDDKPSTDVDDIAGAKNFVSAALDEALAGKPVSVASAPPYGCSVKY
jgi:hypothetical protein